MLLIETKNGKSSLQFVNLGCLQMEVSFKNLMEFADVGSGKADFGSAELISC